MQQVSGRQTRIEEGKSRDRLRERSSSPSEPAPRRGPRGTGRRSAPLGPTTEGRCSWCSNGGGSEERNGLDPSGNLGGRSICHDRAGRRDHDHTVRQHGLCEVLLGGVRDARRLEEPLLIDRTVPAPLQYAATCSWIAARAGDASTANSNRSDPARSTLLIGLNPFSVAYPPQPHADPDRPPRRRRAALSRMKSTVLTRGGSRSVEPSVADGECRVSDVPRDETFDRPAVR
jgi:hypothetical protein